MKEMGKKPTTQFENEMKCRKQRKKTEADEKPIL